MDNGQPLRILVVENHADSRESLRMLLETYGHSVGAAETMREALDLLSTQDWDVLLSDIGLPDGDGWELLRHARPRRPVYAIAMSGYGMNADHERSLAAGYRHHLVKPMASEQLEGILRKVGSVSGGGAG
jgi:two-component system CheB/CheR fusion protein